MKLLVGLMLIGLGILIIRFRYQIYEFTGEWGWASKFLGGNGTVVAIVFIGMFLIGFGTTYPFGYVEIGNKTIISPTSPNASK